MQVASSTNSNFSNEKQEVVLKDEEPVLIALNRITISPDPTVKDLSSWKE